MSFSLSSTETSYPSYMWDRSLSIFRKAIWKGNNRWEKNKSAQINGFIEVIQFSGEWEKRWCILFLVWLRTSSQANPPVNNSPKLWAKYKTQLTEDTEGWTKAGRNGMESISIKKKKKEREKENDSG